MRGYSCMPHSAVRGWSLWSRPRSAVCLTVWLCVPCVFGIAATPQERYRVQLQKLQEMGFSDEEANLSALQAAGGSVNAAIERLLQ